MLKTTDTWDLFESLFNQLSQIPKSQHQSFLQDLDISKELTVQLLEMMSVSDSDHTLLECAASHEEYFQSGLYEPEALVGTQQGDYFITEMIGSGGMASVYKARQISPVKRNVALKVLHSGAPTTVLERFIKEQSLLAKLNHPNISPIYTVGEIDACIPFIAMEYIKGETIARYCNNKKSKLFVRLSLFKQVCCVINFCHQTGILHRDIKPENILIKEIDGQPIPVVIDFGVSSDSQEFSEGDMLLMGTPEYMCPLSFQRDGMPDIRADIYSLGMLLLELLVGKPDFNRKEFEASNITNKQNHLLSWKPKSLKQLIDLSTSKQRQKMADSFAMTEKAWLKSITEEIDCIYKKATDIDPNERYSSAAELSADINCLFDNKPVSAAPASFFYSVKKLVARQKNALLVMTTLMAIVISFLLITLQQKHVFETQMRNTHENLGQIKGEE